MLGTLARIVLMRILPRRVIPILTAWEVLRLIRGRQGRSGQPGQPGQSAIERTTAGPRRP